MKGATLVLTVLWQENMCRDLFSQAKDIPLSNLFWDTEFDRTQPWYPYTWLTMPNSTVTTAVHIGSEVSVAFASEPGNDLPTQWEVVADPELHICTHPPETSRNNADDADHSGVWSEFENLPCKRADDEEWRLEVFLGTCIELQTDAETAASATLSSISSFSTLWQQEATTASVVSALSASAGGVVNAGVSAAIGQVAASAGQNANDGHQVAHIVKVGTL
jgi:hypothetical protein